MNDLTSGTPLKQCARKAECINPLGSLLPATNEYFSKDKGAKDGLLCYCKVCNAAIVKQYREKHPETAKNYHKRNADRIRESRREYRLKNIEKDKATKKKYAANNRERINARRRELRANDPNRFEKDRANYRRYYRMSPLKFQATKERRRARELGLSNTFTADEWEHALEYFGWCCAACGRSVKEPYIAAADHWIPIASPLCPGTVATNMIPLCHTANGCNQSKSDKPALEWLRQRFGDKADEINQRIETYFSSLK